MGVLNINSDSFFQESRINEKKFLKAFNIMIDDGADIVDIGAVSSRPGATNVSHEDELHRLKTIFDIVKQNRLYEQISLSIDSSSPLVLKHACDSGFHIINDITGLVNDEVCEIAAEHQSEVCIMHMQGTPQTMQKSPEYTNVLEEVYTFFESRIKKANSFGIKKIILDVGIGFGKSLEHNIELIAKQSHFLALGYPLLVGASRKSLINNIVPCNTEDRLPGTLVLHLKAIEQGASILRVHDVKEHYQAIKVIQKLNRVAP
jgi:dihydropteroate synthase